MVDRCASEGEWTGPTVGVPVTVLHKMRVSLPLLRERPGVVVVAKIGIVAGGKFATYRVSKTVMSMSAGSLTGDRDRMPF